MEFGVAAAFEGPGAFDDAFVDNFFDRALGGEFVVEAGFEFGEGVLLAREDDEAFGTQVVFGRVLGGGGFAVFRLGAGGVERVLAIGFDWLFGRHLGRSFAG